MRVVATAGHVDHGKSTLVLALTGTDPDRFPEEKARGLTIDLGFAFCTLDSGTEVGFVDVPGHTRFIKNMLAGVGSAEVAMLVIAANEGWKPQSEEHLRILDLLAVQHGIVVISKADLADESLLELARLECEEHLEGTSFAGLEIVACDAQSGRGIDDVRGALDRALAAAPPAPNRDRPRLWIDRVFSAKGSGTVVTGTLTGGEIALDDELVAGTHAVRVRGIQHHGRGADRGEPGARVALNLVGVDHHLLARGDAVVRPDEWRGVDVADVALTVVPGASVARRCRLMAAVGSGEHAVWCHRIGDQFARLRFARPLPLAPGDRIVLRDTGLVATVAGAEILDVTPTRRAADAGSALSVPLADRLLRDGWLAIAGLDARAGLAPDAAKQMVLSAGAEQIGGWLVATSVAAAARESVLTAVAGHHRDQPDDPGITRHDLARDVGIADRQLDALVATLPEIVVEQDRVRHRDHRGRRSESDAGRALLAALEASPFAPPAPDDPALARALAREGALVEIDGIYFAARALDAARKRVIGALDERGSLTVADARDILGSTRKYVVPIMSHLDATGVTRRRGDDRIPGPRSGLGS